MRRDRLIEVNSDLYDIASRLKEIDDYILFYNADKDRFEVHNSRGLQVASPFRGLDARLIEFVRKTRVERLKEILKEIDEHNDKIERDDEKNKLDYFDYNAKDLMKTVAKTSALGADISAPDPDKGGNYDG